MQTILDDYQRKLKTVTEMLKEYDLDYVKYLNTISKHKTETITRLLTKQSEYRSFITDIERMIKRNS